MNNVAFFCWWMSFILCNASVLLTDLFFKLGCSIAFIDVYFDRRQTTNTYGRYGGEFPAKCRQLMEPDFCLPCLLRLCFSSFCFSFFNLPPSPFFPPLSGIICCFIPTTFSHFCLPSSSCFFRLIFSEINTLYLRDCIPLCCCVDNLCFSVLTAVWWKVNCLPLLTLSYVQLLLNHLVRSGSVSVFYLLFILHDSC